MTWLCLLYPAPRRRRPAGGLHPPHEVLDEVLEDRGVELVVDRLAPALGHDEAARPEHGKVARDRRPARVKLGGDLTGCPGTFAKELEDIAPRFVRQRPEGGVRRTCSSSFASLHS